jgi:putative transposase
VKLARLHEKVGNRRADFLHQQSRRRIDENQAIYAEDLHGKGLLGDHRLARTETPGETRAFEAGLRTRKLPALAVE